MRWADHFLQAWRERLARPWIAAGGRVLDIGCHQGELLRGLGDRIGPSVGYYPLAVPADGPRHRLIAEPFRPPAPFPEASFDGVVLLATLEHIQDKQAVARECCRLLRPGGRVVVTVPAPCVDAIVGLLCRVGLADGMALEEHHGFDPAATPAVFGREGLALEHRQQFQFGLNNLFVFRKPLVGSMIRGWPRMTGGDRDQGCTDQGRNSMPGRVIP